MACGEACANAIQHPYGATEGILDVLLARADGEVEVVVSDSGTWRRASPPGGGHGLLLMRAFMDSVEVDTGVAGTVVRMRKRLADGGSA